MPELPEVESVARGLQSLVGQRLVSLRIRDARVWFESELEPAAFVGRKVLEVARRGKYLLYRFDGGITLAQHLRMTGKMLEPTNAAIPELIRAAMESPSGKGLQLRARFQFEKSDLVFYDTRRFGTLTAVRNEEEYFARKKVAPDPIQDPERALRWFLERLQGSTKPIKAALLDQSVVAGVGNIYADEALHASGLHPQLLACKAPDPIRLWKEILRLLRRSIEMGGTTILDYVNAEGRRGEFARLLLVYSRNEQPCRACGGKIVRVILGGRSTHFCPSCQPRRQPSSKGARPARRGKSARSKGAGGAGNSARPREAGSPQS